MKKVKMFVEFSYFFVLAFFGGGTIFLGYYYEMFTSSRNVAYIFFSMMFFLSSCVSWVLKNTLTKIKFDCVKLHQMTISLLEIFAWLLLFLGGSYSAYTVSYVYYNLGRNIFQDIGTALDVIVVFCLIYLFYKIYSNILKRFKK